VGRQPRAFGTDRVLDHLHQQQLAFLQVFLNGFWWCLEAVFRWRKRDVRDMQKRSAIESDIDKRRLHARQHTHNLALIDVAHPAAFAGALDLQFSQHPVFDCRHPGLLG